MKNIRLSKYLKINRNTKLSFLVRFLIVLDLALLGLLFFINNNLFSTLTNTSIFLAFVIVNSLVLLFGLLNNNKLLNLISIGGFVILCSIFPGLVAFSVEGKLDSTKSTRIMSYNLNYLRSVFVPSEKNNETTFDTFKNFMHSIGDIDILCLQETSSISYRPIAEQLNYQNYFGHKGTMIFSKQPFKEKGFIEYEHATDNSCTWATIKVNNTSYRFYSIHLESNKFAQRWNTFEASMSLIEKVDSLIYYWNRADSLRFEQAKVIEVHIAQSPYPVVVCGDFNASPISSIYALFSKKLTDVFCENSNGLGQTYAHIPGLRIDYLFKSPSIESIEYLRRKVNFSDHYPIIIDLFL